MAVTKEILSLAVETGDALLRNGAEACRLRGRYRNAYLRGI